MSNWKNRHHCGQLNIKNKGKTVTLYGWIDTVRDHGQVLFLHVRDRSGSCQVVADPKHNDAYQCAETCRSEFVCEIRGTVRERDEINKNPDMPTGDIEVEATHITLLNKAKTPPFLICEKGSDTPDQKPNVDEDIRLTYRYLDLRRKSMQKNMIQRSRLISLIRRYCDEHEFLDIETPMLCKSTPEGARDYLVPSRLHAEKFYALPQSPQLYKQLLMMSGLERYYQIVRCFRDEDLRPNRQPEFTQMDLEASFIDESFIYEFIEGLIQKLYAHLGITIQTPFPKISYKDAMEHYGCDRPDLRFDMKILNISNIFTNCKYKIFQSIVQKGGQVKGILLKNQADQLSKNFLQEELGKKIIQKLGGKGVSWMKVINGKLESNIVQFFSEAEQQNIMSQFKAENNDVILLVADTNHALLCDVAGRLRLFMAEKCGLIDPKKIAICWVNEFPLFEKKDGRLHAIHHPFTQPSQSLDNLNDDQLLNLNSRAYDIVINGEEVGGGSIRIHDPEMQAQIFSALGLNEKEIDEKFGFFVNALSYGCPPHGGIALGIDRLISILLNEDSIREVIAFPKNRMAVCPLTQAPSPVKTEQLTDLHLKAQVKKTASPPQT
ncbi:MAG: aspartate--tRNA ligase [bacterium]